MPVVKTNMGASFHLLTGAEPFDYTFSAQVLLLVACHCVCLRRYDILPYSLKKQPPDLLKGD